MKRGFPFKCKLCGWTVTGCRRSKKQHQGVCCECHKAMPQIRGLRALGMKLKGIRELLAEGATPTTLRHLADGFIRLKKRSKLAKQLGVKPATIEKFAQLEQWGLHQ